MTKSIALAFAAFAITAGAASAENSFQLDRAGSTGSSIALSNVQADQVSTIQVFAYGGDGKVSQLLGSNQVKAGANGDVAVTLNQPSDARLQILMSNGNRSVVKLETSAPLTN